MRLSPKCVPSMARAGAGKYLSSSFSDTSPTQDDYKPVSSSLSTRGFESDCEVRLSPQLPLNSPERWQHRKKSCVLAENGEG